MAEAICALCAGDMTQPHSVATTGLLEGEWDCHERCFEDFMVGLEARRAEFAELLAAGVDRKAANDIMIARNDGGPPS